jgi:predicted phosphate transport protein (TIGR00153 family)
MKFSFFKKIDFYKLIFEQADKTQEGMEALVNFMNDPVAKNGERVSKLEEEADEIRRILIDELNKAFVTPIDREDIFSLSRSVDDVIDYAETTVEEMLILDIKPDVYIKQMVDILYEASRNVAQAVKNIKYHHNVCVEHIIKAKKSENKIERLYRQALADLFKTNDIINILKTREVYRHLSNAADRVAFAANIISDILVKNT